MEFSLHTAWRELTRRLAVLVAAGAGLISLLADAPVGVAALRGGGAYLAFMLIARIGEVAIQSTSKRAAEASTPAEES